MDQKFSEVATQPTKTVYHIRVPVIKCRIQDNEEGKQQESQLKQDAAGFGMSFESASAANTATMNDTHMGEQELQHLNVYMNIDKGENFGQVLQQMQQIENLENTMDTHAISSMMHLMDSMTRCDKSVNAKRQQNKPPIP